MRKQLWNDGWKLRRKVSSDMGAGSRNPADPVQGEDVHIPDDAMLTMRRSADAPSGPGMAYFHGEDLEYVKEFEIPGEESGLRHVLFFDGVYMDASVSVNGNPVKNHSYGYAPFSVNIDDYLCFGHTNTVTVAVRSPEASNSRWYTGEGICRDVWMYTGGYTHFGVNGVHVTTVDCDRELATVEAEAEVVNEETSVIQGYVALMLRTSFGDFIAERRAAFTAMPGETVRVRQRFDLDEPDLWDADHPALYTCECRLTGRTAEAGSGAAQNGREYSPGAEDALSAVSAAKSRPEILDEDKVIFGIRKLQMDSRNGLRLNGSTVKLRGGCVYPDNGVIGAVSAADAEMRRVSLMKMGGYNAICTSHNPPGPALLDACDRAGVLVIHEFTDTWIRPETPCDCAGSFSHEWERDVEETVRRDFNHPCIVMWSIGSRIPENEDPAGLRLGRELAEKFRELDPARFIAGGINPALTGEAAEEAGDLVDVAGYSRGEDRLGEEHQKYPYRVFTGLGTFPAKLDADWALAGSSPYIIGDFSRAAWDHIGEAGCGRTEVSGPSGDNHPAGYISPEGTSEKASPKEYSLMGKYPWLLAGEGDFDLTGWRRPVSYWRETVWGLRHGQPYIAVQRIPDYGRKMYVSPCAFTDSVESWTWPGYEGRMTAVEVYTDAAEAELLLNGRSLGRKKVGEEGRSCFVSWEVPYEPGELTACVFARKGYQEGKATLETAGNPRLCITNDRVSLRAGSDDLCYLDIELRDEDGILYTDSDRSARIEIDGPGVIAGSGSACPCTEESYAVPEHRFYEGRMQAVIRAGQQRGDILVTVTSEGMEPETVELRSI